MGWGKVTSSKAYHENIASGILSKRRAQVYQYLGRETVRRGRPVTSAEVWKAIFAVYPLIPQHSINPRFAELKRHGVVREGRILTCSVTTFECIGWEIIQGAIAVPLKKAPRLDREIRTMAKKPKGWKPRRNSVWDYRDRVTGEIVTVKIAGTFNTTEGPYANLRGVMDGKSYGNCPVERLIEREK